MTRWVLVACGFVLLLALLLSTGCHGVVLEQLQADLEGLRQRVHAREEVRIHVAAAEPVTKTSHRTDTSEPHVTVAVPQCPPAQAGIVQTIIKKQAAAKKRGRHARSPR